MTYVYIPLLTDEHAESFRLFLGIVFTNKYIPEFTMPEDLELFSKFLVAELNEIVTY